MISMKAHAANLKRKAEAKLAGAKGPQRSVGAAAVQKVMGMDPVPSKNDPRFEEI